jgi:valyl-tRNA synthetase
MKVLIHPKDARVQKILGENKVEIMRLARVTECEITEVSDFSKCAVVPIQQGALQATVVVPLEGLVDFEEEIRRIDKTLEKLEKEIGVLDKKLANPNYAKNAPEEIVNADKTQLGYLSEKVKQLREQRQRLI